MRNIFSSCHKFGAYRCSEVYLKDSSSKGDRQLLAVSLAVSLHQSTSEDAFIMLRDSAIQIKKSLFINLNGRNRKSGVRYFSLIITKRYKPLPRKSTPVPLWDIAPGCILFVPGKTRLPLATLQEVNQYGHHDMCGHPVLVLAVDIKGPNEGTVGVSTIRTYSQHEEEWLGYLHHLSTT
ncbi:hypothetical protein EYC84_002810 [Monilinia fructicola]|uniref:Uncharacterized protein n=1 Tax=Monilinia fructicola TaxID=38448 RepID=A0A5M9JM26_MONFR|nr:hypothetical protein EYC84_002810 [Monilinia fructicola]